MLTSLKGITKKNERKKLLFAASVLVALLPISYLILKNPGTAEAGWWNDSWLYRKRIDITYSGSTTLTDFQVELSAVDTDGLNTQGKLQADCSDLRFTDLSGNILNFWIEDQTDASDTIDCSAADHDIWVNVPAIPDGGMAIFMYYGNNSAQTASNGDETFDFFDDFEDDAFDNLKWGTTDPAVTVANDRLNLNSSQEGISSTDTFGAASPTDNSTSVLTFRAAQDNAAALGRLGFSNTSDITITYTTDDSAAFFFDATTGGNHETETANGGSTQASTVGVAEDTSYHQYTVSITSTDVDFTIDGTTASHSTQVPNTPQYVRLETTDATNTLSVDHVFVRKLATTAPTVPAWGSFDAEEIGPGAVLALNLDEGYGSTANDQTTSNNDGTITGATWQTEEFCVDGNCLYFDGASDDVNIADDNTLDFDGSGSYTVQMWVRHAEMLSGTETVASKFETTGGDGGFEIYFNGSGDITFGIDDDNSSFPEDSVSTSSADYDDNEWHLITATKTDTTNIRLYIDGQLIDTDSSISATGNISNNDPFYLGARSATTNSYTGFIDDIKVYPYARSQTQIQADYSVHESSITGTATGIGASSQDTLSQGLVGYWPMDETAADTCSGGSNDSCDASGNGNDGAWNNGAANTTGKFGAGVAFDGTDDYISVPDNSALSAGDNDLTFTAWVRTDITTATQTILSKWGTDDEKEFTLQTTAGAGRRFRFSWANDGAGDSAAVPADTYGAFNTDQWYFIAAYHDAENNEIGISVDGGPFDVASTTGGNDGGDSFLIGAGSSGTPPSDEWAGDIDEVRYYKRLLTPSEVRQVYSWGPGPEGYWPMDENTGTTTTYDKSGNAYDATLTSMTESSWVPGKFGSSLDFDGGSDYATATSENGDFSTDTYTISAWVYRSADSGAAEIIFDNRDGAGDGNNLHVTAGDVPRCAYNGVGTSGSTTIDLNTWYHLTCTSDGNTLSIYVDGIEENSTATSGSISETTDVTIGTWSHAAPSFHWEGLIDEVRFYNYARTSGQVTEDMNAGHPVGGSPVGSPIGHWSFDEGTGSTTYDKSTNQNNGTLVENAAFVLDGKFNRAMDFDGTQTGDGDTHVRLPDDIFDNETEGTISLWFNTPDSGNTYQGLFNIGEDDNGGFSDYIAIYYRTATNGIEVNIQDDNGSYEYWANTASNVITANTWHHVALTANELGTRFYIDGIEQTMSFSGGDEDSTTWIDDISENTTSYTIGCTDFDGSDNNDCYTNETFTGQIDEVKVYNTALTQEQVLLDFNSGKSTVLGTLSTDSSGAADSSLTRSFCVPGDGGSCSEPVGWWPLDENTGTTTTSDTADTNDGTLTSITESSWAPGKKGAALDLDGGADFVDIGGGPSTVRSIEFWVYPETTTEYFVNLTSTTDYIWLNAGTLTATGLTSPTYYVNGIETQTMVADQWQHVVVTTSTSENASNLDLGRTQDTNYLEGVIDEVRLYDYELTQAQVAWNYNRGKALAHYKVDECSGSTIYDSSENTNNGTLTIGGTSTYTSNGTCDSGTGTEAWNGGTTGKRNASIGLDGADDYISVSDTSELRFDDSAQDYSLTAWAYFDNFTSVNTLLDKRDADNDGYVFQTETDGTLTCSVDGVDVTTSASLSATTWYHLSCTIDRDGNGVIYINGVADGSGTAISSEAMSNTSDLYMGRRSYSSGNYLNGQLDDIQIFNYALTPEQIQSVMQQGAVRFGPSEGSPE